MVLLSSFLCLYSLLVPIFLHINTVDLTHCFDRLNLAIAIHTRQFSEQPLIVPPPRQIKLGKCQFEKHQKTSAWNKDNNLNEYTLERGGAVARGLVLINNPSCLIALRNGVILHNRLADGRGDCHWVEHILICLCQRTT
jgi:hypothetical protein